MLAATGALFLSSVVFIISTDKILLKTLKNNAITVSPDFEEGSFSKVDDLVVFNGSGEEAGAGVVITTTEEGRGSTGTVSPLAVHWQPPVDSCYKKGNDWSACADDHLHYSSSNPEIILNRYYPCLFEPLCWKQLDWRNSDPPRIQCPLDKNIQFYDWSLHDGTMASLSTALEVGMPNITGSNMEVYLCNGKQSKGAIQNYHYDFRQCPSPQPPFINSWNSKASDEAGIHFFNWFKDAPHALQADAHITTFIPPMFDFIMSLNRTIIVNALHRVNLHRCSAEETNHTFENLIRLASSGPSGKYSNNPPHIIAPGYVHDVEYVRHYTGIRPLYLPFSLLNVLPQSLQGKEYNGENGMFIWNAQKFRVPSELANYTMIVPKNYELSDLLKYRAAIVLPYSITNTKSLEQYEMNIPLFVPSPNFALELGLFHDRTATYGPYCSKFTNEMHPRGHHSSPFDFSPNARKAHGDSAEDELFWISFSEVYLWPCVEYFDSWIELGQKLGNSTDQTLYSTSQCMKRSNKWRKWESESNLCWALKQMKRGQAALGNLTYEDALLSLYNETSLF